MSMKDTGYNDPEMRKSPAEIAENEGGNLHNDLDVEAVVAVLENELQTQHLKVADLIKKTGIPSSTMYMIFDSYRRPEFMDLIRICEALHMSVGRLYTEANRAQSDDLKMHPLLLEMMPSLEKLDERAQKRIAGMIRVEVDNAAEDGTIGGTVDYVIRTPRKTASKDKK